jgi:hypothetical protein
MNCEVRSKERRGRWARRARRCASILILIASTQSCNRKPPCRSDGWLPPEALPGKPPVAAVNQRGKRIVFYPTSGSDWAELVDLSLFDGLWPGIQVDEAREILGEPGLHFERLMSDDWVYITPNGEITISFADQSSPPFYFIPKRWVLEGRPASNEVASIFHPSVLEHFPTDTPQFEVVIMNNCRYPGITAHIDNGKVEDLTWLNNPGSLPQDNARHRTPQRSPERYGAAP